MTAVSSIDIFARSIRERLFVPQPPECRRVGAEIELLPMLAEGGRPCPLYEGDDGQLSTLGFLRPYGALAGWQEQQSAKGAPYFALPNGSTLTFEPGGQLELCTPPRQSLTELLAGARATLTALRRAARDAGIELVSVGIDPRNSIDTISLQIASPRYAEMTRYFESIGPSGVRMMRQTAATQVSLDPGSDPESRWRLLCDLTPYLTAMFANSRRYAGEDSGYMSFRASCWRLLDPSRTGVPAPVVAPCEAYTRFALDAVDMWRTDERGQYKPFADWVAEERWDERQWESHLSTLFPEVRPRGHLEVRCIDALDPELLGVPLVLLAGLAYNPPSEAEAMALLPHADEDMLNRAARRGMHDPQLAETACELATLGMHGARALGSATVDGEELERAEQFLADWTYRGRSPADAP
jgi:glutamate--cysteine ligase